jgi:hypothetical protein
MIVSKNKGKGSVPDLAERVRGKSDNSKHLEASSSLWFSFLISHRRFRKLFTKCRNPMAILLWRGVVWTTPLVMRWTLLADQVVLVAWNIEAILATLIGKIRIERLIRDSREDPWRGSFNESSDADAWRLFALDLLPNSWPTLRTGGSDVRELILWQFPKLGYICCLLNPKSVNLQKNTLASSTFYAFT